MAPLTRPSSLRLALTGPAAELYDYVQSRYPRFEDGFMSRRGASVDDAFRHLLRAALDGTPMPQGWQSAVWPDDEVTAAAQDAETRRRAWALLADASPDGWRALWVKHNKQDQLFTYALFLVGALILLGVVVWNVAA